ncbi:hydroxymyristoyl-ACP dehydratase [Undibacterium sp.]|jgi:predicted hotdog family 3-hydroxylacyl-ACP dehydratase|uniref:hydroxymyristoyl-ACP dehydratase n=1 Tax=Undibacterium sp. TaxID=1914977 RepID=UPI002BD1A6FC|nr:hydroxymyristoyl-ACP dehydratase [Undibacterium sp.]HTD02946.1 hydroxymyristoyl-ACP dehydratase [Undibacterium sp.]
MLSKIDIPSLIPHQRGMCLLEQVVSWDETWIRCLTSSHHNPAHPLRSKSGLLSVCGVEYAAQAIAVHGGLIAAQQPDFRASSIGYLANAKDVSWSVDRLDDIDGDLQVDAEQLISEGGRSIYAFNLSAGGRDLMQGRIAVVLEGAAA